METINSDNTSEIIMTLPPYEKSIHWKEYEIDTPTFELTPIEKPDMSPFLIHMTGQSAIESILTGVGSTNPQPSNHGYLKSSIPEYVKDIFNVPVVCFTESPIFALDFFRYRSFKRWRDDQRFGIGFRKTVLVHKDVRPVVYVDKNTRKHFIDLYKLGIENEQKFSADITINDHIRGILDNLCPFLFPLLEDRNEQGFMWEREWRYSDPVGFSFHFDSIAVICAPDDEKEKIKRILGEFASRIQFVNTWREYDEVINFLEHQQSKWQISVENVEEIEAKLALLVQVNKQYEIAINSLNTYEEFILNLTSKRESLEQERAGLREKSGEVKGQIHDLKIKLKTKKI